MVKVNGRGICLLRSVRSHKRTGAVPSSLPWRRRESRPATRSSRGAMGPGSWRRARRGPGNPAKTWSSSRQPRGCESCAAAWNASHAEQAEETVTGQTNGQDTRTRSPGHYYDQTETSRRAEEQRAPCTAWHCKSPAGKNTRSISLST